MNLNQQLYLPVRNLNNRAEHSQKENKPHHKKGITPRSRREETLQKTLESVESLNHDNSKITLDLELPGGNDSDRLIIDQNENILEVVHNYCKINGLGKTIEECILEMIVEKIKNGKKALQPGNSAHMKYSSKAELEERLSQGNYSSQKGYLNYGSQTSLYRESSDLNYGSLASVQQFKIDSVYHENPSKSQNFQNDSNQPIQKDVQSPIDYSVSPMPPQNSPLPGSYLMNSPSASINIPTKPFDSGHLLKAHPLETVPEYDSRSRCSQTSREEKLKNSQVSPRISMPQENTAHKKRLPQYASVEDYINRYGSTSRSKSLNGSRLRTSRSLDKSRGNIGVLDSISKVGCTEEELENRLYLKQKPTRNIGINHQINEELNPTTQLRLKMKFSNQRKSLSILQRIS